MIIEDKVPEIEKIKYKIDEPIIYLADLTVKVSYRKLGKNRSQIFQFNDEVFCETRDNETENYFDTCLRNQIIKISKFTLKSKFTIEVVKAVLKKELSYKIINKKP